MSILRPARRLRPVLLAGAALLLVTALPARPDAPSLAEAERIDEAKDKARSAAAKDAQQLKASVDAMKAEQEALTRETEALDAQQAEKDLAAVESIRQQQQKALDRTQDATARRGNDKPDAT